MNDLTIAELFHETGGGGNKLSTAGGHGWTDSEDDAGDDESKDHVDLGDGQRPRSSGDGMPTLHTRNQGGNQIREENPHKEREEGVTSTIDERRPYEKDEQSARDPKGSWIENWHTDLS